MVSLDNKISPTRIHGCVKYQTTGIPTKNALDGTETVENTNTNKLYESLIYAADNCLKDYVMYDELNEIIVYSLFEFWNNHN